MLQILCISYYFLILFVVLITSSKYNYLMIFVYPADKG